MAENVGNDNSGGKILKFLRAYMLPHPPSHLCVKKVWTFNKGRTTFLLSGKIMSTPSPPNYFARTPMVKFAPESEVLDLAAWYSLDERTNENANI